VLITIGLGVADYWAIAAIFENLYQELRTSSDQIEWDDITQNIENSSCSVQAKFASTVAAFGVEVCLLCKSISRTRSGPGLSRISL
jgi:hypothetical protein